MNASETFLHDERYKTQIMILLVLDSIAALCTVVGNGVFMAILLLKRSLHTPPNVLLGALCLSDLLVGTVVQPLYIIDFTYKLVGRSFEHFLKAKTILTWFCVGLSFQHILLISLDRYVALCHPFRYHMYATCKLHIRICTFTSILPLSVTAVSIILFVKHYLTVRNYILSGVLLISLVAVAFANWKVFCILLHQKQKIVAVGEIAAEDRRQIRKGKQERKKTYVIAIVLILFFICYLPLFVQFLLQFWHEKVFPSIVRYQIFDLWTDFFMLLNSVTNPLIYYARMKEIRQAAAVVICRRPWSTVEKEYTSSK